MNENPNGDIFRELDISDEDINKAMREIPGYLDITPGDFKEIYRLAYKYAVERLTRFVKAKDIMTRKVFSARRDTPLLEVAEIMAHAGVAGIPVLEADGKVAGIVSEKDFLRTMEGESARSFMSLVARCLKEERFAVLPTGVKKAEDIMSFPAITVGEDATIMEIADIFTERKINRVPVVDEKGCMVGIVSRANIVRAVRIKKSG